MRNHKYSGSGGDNQKKGILFHSLVLVVTPNDGGVFFLVKIKGGG